MSDQRPEIQRYEIGGWDGEMRKSKAPPEEGDMVDYYDHLRHVTLAKIAVLEELQEADFGDLSMCDDSAGWYADKVGDWIEEKIAALRKELEG